jgi:integrase
MARHTRAAKLETRTARLRLPIAKKPVFIVLSPGVACGYRRNRGPGVWVARVSNGHGKQWTKKIALADDHEDADDQHVLTWWQAQDKARALARGTDDAGRPVTVAEALDDYERDLVARGGDAGNARRARGHLTNALAGRPVAILTAKELRRWRDGMGCRSPATLNRVLTTVKAALNLAAQHDPRITNRDVWRIGLAGLPDAYVARNALLSDQEVRALIGAAWETDPALGLLVEVAAVTGARVSQLRRIEIGDLRSDAVLMMPRALKGRRKRVERRPVPIPESLARKLSSAAIGRPATEALLLRSDGRPWEHNSHSKPFAKVAAKAGITATIYSLRHSAIVRSLLAGVPIRLVANNSDTSVVMIERTYSWYIGDHSDALTRKALLDPAARP